MKAQWRAAMGATTPDDPDALTINELAQLCGLSRRSTQERIVKMLEQGLVTQHRKRVRNAANQMQPVSAYKLVKPDKAKR